MKKNYLLLVLIALTSSFLKAQCPVGQVQVTITVTTDDWGYEGYWQLVPMGNSCGTGTIFSGGNALVGCSGGSLQVATSGGYANNTQIIEGPWCLTQGSYFDILYVDDYGDGGASFTVNINGYPVYSGLTGPGNGTGSHITFLAEPASTLDLMCKKITTPSYVNPGNVNVSGVIFNNGTDTITSMDLNYSINNGSIITGNITGLHFAPFSSLSVIHPNSWSTSVNGQYQLKMWASNMNGMSDLNSTNDTATSVVNVGPAIPNLIDDYIGITPILTVIGNATDGIASPRDLDFHPVLTRNELWVVLESTEAIGGKTVKFTNAGQPGQTSLLQQDGNAWHFMSLPTGIAFSDNENFCTSPGVYDANHNGGTPFTGPSLWSSNPLIYAQPSGGNGSHIDMLHQSPYSMGVCSETENVFWIFDGNAGEVVRYDYVNDHGPGNSDHSDGIIRRFSGLNLLAESTHHVSSHLILDKENGMLYIVDTGHDRIVRMDIHSGTFLSNLTPYEPTAEYSNWGSTINNVFADSGLTTPSGIDLIGNRLIVSDYSTGDIIIYDRSASIGLELGRISTGTPGIMGVKIGPDGKIWYVNATTNQVIRIDGITNDLTAINPNESISVYPNPVSTNLFVKTNSLKGSALLFIYDMTGKLIRSERIFSTERSVQVNVEALQSGVYTIEVINSNSTIRKRFVKN